MKVIACLFVLFVAVVVASPPAPIKPAGQGWPNYDQLTSLAEAFIAAIHISHDSNATHPLNPDCSTFVPLFSKDAKIVSSNNTFTPEMFCLLWTAIPVHYHITEFKSTMIEDVPVNGYQTIGFFIVDVGTLVYKDCPFTVPNVAWLRVNQALEITYLEFVTDSRAFANCFGAK